MTASTDQQAGAATTRPAVCPICSAPFDSLSRELNGRRLCGHCGTATTDPWPSDMELDAAYGEWYRPSTGRFSGPGDALLRRSRARLADRIARIAPPGPVLDVGSGDGALLEALRARGREAVGLERPADGSAPGSAADGWEAADPSRRYAAVVFWHSLEHLREPGAALERTASMLHDGGLLIVAMPNSASIQARVFGDRWFALDLPRHLVHVPAAALRNRIEQSGLKVRSVSHWRGGQSVFGWLYGLIELLPGRPSLYDAIRRSEARARPLGPVARAAVLAAAVLLLPAAAAAAAVEALAGRGGTVYVEAVQRGGESV